MTVVAPTIVRCVTCGHEWVTTDGRRLAMPPGTPVTRARWLASHIRCGACALDRARSKTLARVRRFRATRSPQSVCNAQSAPTLTDTRPQRHSGAAGA